MIQLFRKHILQNFPFLQDSKLLVACSGGIDSMVLTHLLFEIETNALTLAHCNFQLRGEDANLDEKFVIDQAKKRGVSVLINHFKTENYSKEKGVSIQMAARELRYQWFDELIQNNNFDYVLTAHHADDTLETFLINLSRGTGLEGLTGIPSINNKTIRPLLIFSRNQIENYAIDENLSWREDKSNAQTKYLRNKLRHDLIPLLKELNPNFMGSFANTINNLQGSQQMIKDSIQSLKKEIVESENGYKKINLKILKRLSNPKSYLFELLKGYGFTEWNDLTKLLEAQSGKQILSPTHRLIKDRSHLLLSKITGQIENQKYLIEENSLKHSNIDFKLNIVLNYKGNLDKTNPSVTYIDKSLLNFPLIVRKWEKGDYFYPIGMKGSKKLSKFFKDEKFSILEKEHTWLLCSANNEIVWIIDRRMDDRFKVVENTTQILRIKYETNP